MAAAFHHPARPVGVAVAAAADDKTSKVLETFEVCLDDGAVRADRAEWLNRVLE